MSSFSPMNKRGFSLVELMISMGILVFVLFIFVAILEQFQRKTISAEGQTQYRLDLALIERMVFDDLNWSFPSIGNLSLMGTDNREFFQYFGGVPVERIPAADRTREFAMTLAANRDFEFIAEDPKAGDRRYFHPADAYNYRLSLLTATPLTFASMNLGNFFTTHYAGHWAAGGHFLLYAPSPLRDLRAGGSIAPVRFYSILGYSAGSDVTLDNMANLLKTAHPHITADITNMDNFLRLIPTLGGAMAHLVVTPVRVIRYRLEPDPRSGAARLVRSVRTGTTYGPNIFLGGGIEKIVFTRPDVTARRIEFHVQLKRSE